MKTYKSETQPKMAGVKNFWANLKNAVVGVARLAFISACGVASYVLWFSSDSLTLKVVAGVLAMGTAVQALAMSSKR